MLRLQSLLLWLEAALLALLGAGMIQLSLSPVYWQFLNPKFVPLTLAGGALCALLAVGHPFGAGRFKRTSILCMVLFLCIAGQAWQSTKTGVFSEYAVNGFDPGPPPDSVNFSDDSEPEPARLTLDGQEYVRLNIMELWLMLEEDGAAPQRLVLQGQLLRLPGRSDRYVVARVAVACCLADAVAVGIIVDGPLPAGAMEGSWVRIAGTVAPASEAPPKFGTLMLPGVTMTMVHERFKLMAEDARATDDPEVPFIFDFRASEPYAY